MPQTNSLNMFLTNFHDNHVEVLKPPLKGEGWGSPEATKMVLNNLFYMTVKVCMICFYLIFKKFWTTFSGVKIFTILD